MSLTFPSTPKEMLREAQHNEQLKKWRGNPNQSYFFVTLRLSRTFMLDGLVPYFIFCHTIFPSSDNFGETNSTATATVWV